MKGLFKDVLQEVLEAELDETLGYGKHEVSEKQIGKTTKKLADAMEIKPNNITPMKRESLCLCFSCHKRTLPRDYHQNLDFHSQFWNI